MIDMHVEICGCMELNTFHYYVAKPLPESAFCTPRQSYECAKFVRTNVSFMIDKCFNIDVCPESCVYWRYQTYLSSSPIVRNQMEIPLQEYHKSNLSSNYCVYIIFCCRSIAKQSKYFPIFFIWELSNFFIRFSSAFNFNFVNFGKVKASSISRPLSIIHYFCVFLCFAWNIWRTESNLLHYRANWYKHCTRWH